MEALLLPGLVCPIWLWLQCLSDHFISLVPNMFKVPGKRARMASCVGQGAAEKKENDIP